MKSKVIQILRIMNFNKQEWSFVIAMILMAIFNFSLVALMLN